MGTDTSDGQVDTDLSEVTVDTPKADGGQSVALSQTTGSGSGSGDVELFYDPKSIEGKPELELLAKQLQGDYTKKLMAFSEGKSKVEQYDAFMANPLVTMQQLAAERGWTLMEGAAQAEGNGEFQPNTWDDVEKHLLDKARQELRKEFAPLTSEVKDLKRKNVESQLDKEHPDWRMYESEMSDLLQRHPTLVNDVDSLYAMSVPKELLEQRATKTALSKIKDGTDSSAIGDNKTTSISTTDQPTKPLSFNEAVTFAKHKLGKAGLTAPVG